MSRLPRIAEGETLNVLPVLSPFDLPDRTDYPPHARLETERKLAEEGASINVVVHSGDSVRV